MQIVVVLLLLLHVELDLHCNLTVLPVGTDGAACLPLVGLVGLMILHTTMTMFLVGLGGILVGEVGDGWNLLAGLVGFHLLDGLVVKRFLVLQQLLFLVGLVGLVVTWLKVEQKVERLAFLMNSQRLFVVLMFSVLDPLG